MPASQSGLRSALTGSGSASVATARTTTRGSTAFGLPNESRIRPARLRRAGSNRFHGPDRALAVKVRANRPRQRCEAKAVVEGAKDVQAPPYGTAAEDVTGEERNHGSRQAQHLLRVHDEVSHRGRGHAVDHPREHPQSPAHLPVELAVEPRGGARIQETPVDDIGPEKRAVHSEVDPAREDGVDEGIRV